MYTRTKLTVSQVDKNNINWMLHNTNNTNWMLRMIIAE